MLFGGDRFADAKEDPHKSVVELLATETPSVELEAYVGFVDAFPPNDKPWTGVAAAIMGLATATKAAKNVLPMMTKVPQ